MYLCTIIKRFMRKFLLLALLSAASMTQVQAQIIKPRHGQKITQSIKDGFNTVMETIKQDVKPTGTHEVMSGCIYPKLGVSLTSLTGVGGDPKLSITGGVGIEMYVHPRVGVAMELLYSHQGTTDVYHTITTNSTAEEGTGETLTSGPYKYCFNFIETTLTGRWYPRATIPFSIYSGISLSREMSAKATIDDNKTNLHSNDHVRKYDISIPIGLTYEFGQVALDVRYNHSFFHVASSGTAKRLLGDARHMRFAATVAYRIPLF